MGHQSFLSIFMPICPHENSHWLDAEVTTFEQQVPNLKLQ